MGVPVVASIVLVASLVLSIPPAALPGGANLSHPIASQSNPPSAVRSSITPVTTPVAQEPSSTHPGGEWTQLHPQSHPSPRLGAGMVYDATDGYILLFGGTYLGGNSTWGYWGCLNDTWMFRGGVWTNLSIPGPPPACSPSLAYDPDLGYVLAYIGTYQIPGRLNSTTVEVNETWRFVGGIWTEVNVSGPAPGDGFLGSSYNPAQYDASTRSVESLQLNLVQQNGNLAERAIRWQFYSGEW